MKPEKYLKKAAKAEQKQILENGGELLSSLEAQIPQKKKKRRVAVWLSVAATSLALIITAVCVGVFAFREEEIIYHDGNIAFEKSNFFELESTCREFTMDPSSAEYLSFSKAYDSLSGDTLYFVINIAGIVGASANIIIVSNPNYHYTFLTEPLLQSREINGYTLSYDLQISPKQEIFGINAWGEIDGTRETVYITFMQISEREDNETFFAFIQNTIRKK